MSSAPGGKSGRQLRSFPVPSADSDMQQEDADEEIHRDEDVSIKVQGILALLGRSYVETGEEAPRLPRGASADAAGPTQFLPSVPRLLLLQVTQSPGFLCHIEATAAFRMPARALFKQVITHPGEGACPSRSMPGAGACRE